jgi:hypothetical protein
MPEAVADEVTLPSNSKDTPKSPLAKSLASKRRELRYPLDIDRLDHWMVFKVNHPKFARKEDFPKKSSIRLIYLPIPANLGTQYGQEYNTEGLGIAGMAGAAAGGAGAAGGISSVIDMAASVSRADLGAATQYYGLMAAEQNAGALVGAQLGGIAGALAGAAAGQAVKGAIAGAGIARNPYMAVLYSQPSFREYTFQWKLVAKSREETLAIEDIIKAFKFHAAPGINSNNKHFFDYPEQFDIDFHHAKHLFNPAPSVCKTVEVNYHAEGQPLYHDFSASEKSPVSVNLSLTFQEISIVTKDSIEKSNR